MSLRTVLAEGTFPGPLIAAEKVIALPQLGSRWVLTLPVSKGR